MWSATINQAELERAQAVMGDAPELNKLDRSDSKLVTAPFLPSQIGNLLRYSGATSRQVGNLSLRFVIWGVCVVALPAITGKPLLFLPGAILLVAEFLIIKRKVFIRAEGFERDYPALLVALASSVRTGLDPLVALTQSEQLFSPQSEMGKELHSFRLSIERGETEERALASFGASIAHPDIPLFRTAFVLSRRQGASLGQCMHRLAKVTRQRQSFRRKVRSAVAMQKLSAVGIGGCAIVIGAIQVASNPAALSAAWQNPVGQRLLMLGVGLILAGLGWMMNMARSRM